MKGIGTDIIEISRIERSIAQHKKHFLNRIFTPKEQAYCQRYRQSAPHFAARFAAKEAVVKALGTGFRGGISWQDIEICNDKQGKPTIVLSAKLQAMFDHPQFLLSMSHSRSHAIATALWL